MEIILIKDPAIDKAIEILNDTEKYNSILKGTCKDANHQIKIEE